MEKWCIILSKPQGAHIFAYVPPSCTIYCKCSVIIHRVENITGHLTISLLQCITQAYRDSRYNVKYSLPHRRQHSRICVVNAEENSGTDSSCFSLDQSWSELTESAYHLEKRPSHLWSNTRQR